MALSFQPVTLDGNAPDHKATLVFRDGRLLAVLACLSDIHAELAGQWFIEATFGDMPRPRPSAFETLDRFTQWLAPAR